MASKDLVTIPLPIARGGLNKDIASVSLEGVYTPYAKNMIFEARRVRKRLGYRQYGTNLPLTGTGQKLVNYIDGVGTAHTIAITTTNAYEYDGDSGHWIPITPSKYLEDCEAGFTAGTNVTVSHDTTVYLRTAKSLKMVTTDALSDGDQMAYKDISSADITAHSHIGFWIYSTAALTAGDIEVVISESNHAAGEKTGTYVECANSAVAANTWTFVQLAKTLTAFNAVVSVSVYANATIASGAVIYIDDVRAYTPLAGAVAKPVNATLATDLNEFTSNDGTVLVITNGVDDVFYYEGDANDLLETLVHGYASFANTVEVEEFWNHLMFLNFNDGSQHVRSVAWADVGDVDNFSAGTSGLSYLTDSRGEIIKSLKLGQSLMIYSERSITECRYYGGQTVFVFPTIVYSAGLYAADAIVETMGLHYFLSTEKRIVEYSGGLQLKSIGKAIEASLFSEADSSKKAYFVCGFDESNDRIYFCFPRSGDSYAKAAYCLNRRQPERPFEYFEFADDIRSFVMSTVDIVSAWYCDDAQFTGIYCDEVSFYCDTSTAQEGYPILLTLSSDGYVFQHDEVDGQDDDTDIECEYQTQDLTVDKEEHFARWKWLTFVAKSSLYGGTVSVFYSSDEGDTWTEFNDSPVTLTSDWAVSRLPMDVVSRKMRFRFYQNSDADLQLRDDMHISFTPEEARS